ncbi:MAG TPA: LuxR C-terminal-related transcriptional regulator [Anaerolineaceae bacterium]|nr:LuxR C-terminal-related transcriptional regulator [Anaerolineaceae bacterium]HPN50596.1 LuxR C-terminal-related transcriptional regulator [Anaerolineaceae bacterium]
MKPLLSTKLTPPRLRQDLVLRPQLISRLDAGLDRDVKLFLISAPAGAGKTTLLASWLAHLPKGISCAWLSLDEGDNDLPYFAAYLTAAIQRIIPEFGQETRSLLELPAGIFQPDALQACLASDLAAVDSPLLLVLDDLHLIMQGGVMHLLAFLLDHLPEKIHLVFATRSDPTVPLSRLRARGQMVEIRADDLSFSPVEADAYLNQALRLSLTDEQVLDLQIHTEGWAAGLHLAALALQRKAQNREQFLAEFTGGHHYILDYLIEEVLNQLPEDVRTFLYKTSILPRLTGELCNALTGCKDGQQTLEMLERHNLFIIPLDESRTWYRYHQLFGEVLRNRLHSLWQDAAEAKEQRQRLYHASSIWYEKNGLTGDAVEQSLAGEDYERAAALMERGAAQPTGPGEIWQARRWLDAMPEAVMNRHAFLCLTKAWVLISYGEHDKVEEILKKAVAAAPENRAVQGEAGALLSLVAVLRGEARPAVELAMAARTWLSETDITLLGMINLNLGMAYEQLGKLELARHCYEEILERGQGKDQLFLRLSASSQLADLRSKQGFLQDALSLYQRALAIIREEGKPASLAAMTYAWMGRLFYELNDLDEAEKILRQARALSRYWESVDIYLISCVYLTCILDARGEKAESRQFEAEARTLLDRPVTSLSTLDLAKALLAQMHLKNGDIPGACRWGGLIPGPADSRPYADHAAAVLQIRLALAGKRTGEAWNAARSCLERLPGNENLGEALEVLWLAALTAAEMGNREQAFEYLERALNIAEGGHARIFIDEGERGRDLLAAFCRDEDSAPEAIGTARRILLQGWPAERNPAARSNLSEKELQVLQWMAEGLSNQEIAARSFTAVSTVKTHINHIFSKLGVESRVQAITQARLRGLLA